MLGIKVNNLHTVRLSVTERKVQTILSNATQRYRG